MSNIKIYATEVKYRFLLLSSLIYIVDKMSLTFVEQPPLCMLYG